MTQEGVEDDEGEELFSHQKEAGNYGHETSVFVRGFYLFKLVLENLELSWAHVQYLKY